MAENEDWRRLQDAVAARIKDLDLKQAEIQSLGGPSPAKVREITSGRATALSTSKRRDLERALRWAPGSIDTTLAGGDPAPLEGEPDADLASRMLHPSRRVQVADLIANDSDMAQILERLVTYGRVDEVDRARIEHALDDIRIGKFPTIFESLSRPGKLQVVDFGSSVLTEEFLSKEKSDDLETAPQPGAQTQAGPAEEVVSSSDDAEPSAADIADASLAAGVAELEVDSVDDDGEQAN